MTQEFKKKEPKDKEEKKISVSDIGGTPIKDEYIMKAGSVTKEAKQDKAVDSGDEIKKTRKIG